jgi:hypothetical protein
MIKLTYNIMKKIKSIRMHELNYRVTLRFIICTISSLVKNCN